MTQSSDCKSDLVIVHASRLHKSTGKHLLLITLLLQSDLFRRIHATIFEHTAFAARENTCQRYPKPHL